jgi:hypothetical protein
MFHAQLNSTNNRTRDLASNVSTYTDDEEIPCCYITLGSYCQLQRTPSWDLTLCKTFKFHADVSWFYSQLFMQCSNGANLGLMDRP